MPDSIVAFDAKGALLNLNDFVSVRCRVVGVASVETNRALCNVTLVVESTDASKKRGVTYFPHLCLNSTLCEKESAP